MMMHNDFETPERFHTEKHKRQAGGAGQFAPKPEKNKARSSGNCDHYCHSGSLRHLLGKNRQCNNVEKYGCVPYSVHQEAKARHHDKDVSKATWNDVASLKNVEKSGCVPYSVHQG